MLAWLGTLHYSTHNRRHVSVSSDVGIRVFQTSYPLKRGPCCRGAFERQKLNQPSGKGGLGLNETWPCLAYRFYDMIRLDPLHSPSPMPATQQEEVMFFSDPEKTKGFRTIAGQTSRNSPPGWCQNVIGEEW
jgi:hypothetical protein